MAERIIGIIGGTGLGTVLAEHMKDVASHKAATPFGDASGEIITGLIGDYRVAFVNRHGPGHKFSPDKVPYAANVFALKALGARSLVGIGAVGSLREQISPGQLVLADQLIDKTYKRANTFFQDAAVHCEFSEPVCSRLRAAFMRQGAQQQVPSHNSGCYICMEGPTFSTRAESKMHRNWGGDLIGMTALPEARLAREAQMCYVLVALVSDYDCWRQHEGNEDGLLDEIMANLNQATQNCISLVVSTLKSQDDLLDENCNCRHSLEKAIWTAPEHRGPGWEKLRPLMD